MRAVELDANLRIDIDKLVEASKGAGLVFFCNPNNPTATVHGAPAVADFVKRVRAASPDTVILIDEAYHDYVTDPSYKTAMDIALSDAERVRDAHLLEGLRHGRPARRLCGRRRAEVIKALNAYRMPYALVNLPAIARPSWRSATRRTSTPSATRNTDVKAFTVKAFEQMGFKATDSQTNFIFVDIKRPAAGFRDACRAAGVMVGRDFPPYEKTALPHLHRHAGRNGARGRRLQEGPWFARPTRREPGRAVTRGSRVKEDSTMSLSRRRFVQTLGAGAAGLWVAGRGREAGLFDLGFEALLGAGPAPRSSWRATRIRSARHGPCSTPCAAAFGELGRYQFATTAEVTELIAKKHGIKPENVLLGSGSTQILRTTTHVFCSQDRPLVAPIPAYEECAGYAALMGYPVSTVKLTPPPELKMDMAALLRHSKGGGMVFFCNPNNPVATAVDGKTTRGLHRPALGKSSPNTTTLVDEAYFEYATMPGYETMIPLAIENPRVVVARTFSKAFGMAGLRIGYAVGHRDSIAKMRAWDADGAVNVLGLSAARAALTQSPTSSRPRASATPRRARSPPKWFADRGYTPTDSQTNFLFVDIKRPARGFREVCAKQGILVGRDFPPYEKTHCRISISTMEDMQRAVKVFEQALAQPVQTAADGRGSTCTQVSTAGERPRLWGSTGSRILSTCESALLRMEPRSFVCSRAGRRPMEIDRRAFIASLGGTGRRRGDVSGSEGRGARAPLERSARRDRSATSTRRRGEQVVPAPPEATVRRGAGTLFTPQGPANARKMPVLAPMPAKPTLVDFFNLRFAPANHVLQSATRALKTGMTEQSILACLLHDVVQNLIKVDHGWWGAQMIVPYVDEKVAGRSTITRRCASIPIRRPATSIPSSTSASTARTTCRRSTSRTPTSTRRSTSGTWRRG